MTGLPTEPGSVIGWMNRDYPLAASLVPSGLWWVGGGDRPLTPTELADGLTDASWWYMGRVTPDGITTTR